MVYVKRMVCIGFKSFRKKTIVNFDKGFTAIVGANGSGKSNIIDAFVFVLGELSAKTLRANNIKDLISNGGNGLDPAETASVEIVFDNTSKAIPIDSEEVSVLRKIDRNGNGIYKLNGKKSTRKEIMDLLDLGGLMPNSSNMIMQGELFRLINMNPTERRQLIEDIAGISSYNEKKASAQDELTQVQANLGQISLLLNEVYIQLEQLEKEKNDALEYLNLVKQEKMRNNALYSVKISGATQQIAEMQQKKKDFELKIEEIGIKETAAREEIAALQAQFDELQGKIKGVEDSELLQLTSNLKRIKDTITELTTSIRYSEKNTAMYEKEKNAFQERLNGLDHEEEQLKKEIATIEQSKNSVSDQIEEKTQKISELEQQLTQIDSQYVKIKEELRETQVILTQSKDQKNQVVTSLSVVENQIAGLQRNKQKLEQKIFANHQELAKAKQSLRELQQQKAEKLGLEDAEENFKDAIEKNIKLCEQEVIKLQQEQKELGRLSSTAHAELVELKSKLKVIKQMESGGQAVETLLKLKRSGEIQGIYGTVADLGSTDPMFAVAMEMAAGNKFNFLIVENQLVAEKCINYLKQNRLGRASFIPLNEIKSNPYYQALPKNSRVYGRAVDLIKFDGKFLPAFEFLFGRTVIVEDLETARLLNLPLRRVTLEGDIVEGSNLMTGGQQGRPKGIGFKSNEGENLGRLQSVYEDYQSRIETNDRRIKELQQEISKLYREKISGQKDTQQLNEQITLKKARLEQIKTDIQQDEAEIVEILQQLEQLNQEKEVLTQKLATYNSQIESIEAQEREIHTKLNSSEESQLKDLLRNLEKDLKKLNKQAMQIEVDLTKKTTLLNETVYNGRKQLSTQINEKITAISETNNSLGNMRVQLKEKEMESTVIEEKISQKSQILSQLLSEKKGVALKMSDAKTLLGQLDIQKHPLSMELNTIDIKSSDYHSKILEWNCHLLPDIEIPAELLTIPENEHQAEIERVKQKKEALGAVNLRAIEKYEEINARFKELEVKNEQIIEEREAILQFIESLENEKKRVFMNTFNAINKNFGFIFTKLSPCGEAKLELDNLEDPFAGGLEIMARPGEKKWCLTQAMSGGEKTLTIIALILGIQMHVPSPYYVLDEIDAALDDANAALVADMIKELSEKSQFIMITHRDVSMARTDHLLGVSNVSGVTSVINLSIKNVLKQLKEAEETALSVES